MILLNDIVDYFNSVAPIELQEGYDNSGLLVGDLNMKVSSALITIDITETVVLEAIENNCQLIISHHPLTLDGFKNITGRSEPERCLLLAIQHNIAIFSAHTNIDAIPNGVSGRMANLLGLENTKILSPLKNSLTKLSVFVPISHSDVVRQAIFNSGGGHIGNYSHCSFNSEGVGSFLGDDSSSPYVGDKGTLHFENEVKIETILLSFKSATVVKAIKAVHPYQEVAYDLIPLANQWMDAGFGIYGELPQKVKVMDFLLQLKNIFKLSMLRYTNPHIEYVQRIALCGGSGSSLIPKALAVKADLYITGDIKYHQFFDADNRIILADIGHFESEQFTKDLFFELLTKKFPNFAVRLSQVSSNPIKYL